MTDRPIIEDPLDDTSLNDLLQKVTGTKYHTVLQLWREVMTSAQTPTIRRISPQWAARIVTSYPGLTFRDMPLFRDRYLERIGELLTILEDLIDQDPRCLEPSTPAEDVQENGDRYLEIITEWQKKILGWELDWDCMGDAAADLASFSEVHRTIFGQEGFASLLDSIGFEFTDMHRDALSLSLREFQAQKEGDGE